MKSLLTGPQLKAAIFRYRKLQIDSKMLVRSQVIDNASPRSAPDHVCVKPPQPGGFKSSHPRDRLPSQRVTIRIVLNSERNIRPLFRKHDAAPRPYIKKRQCIRRAMPQPFHSPGSHRSHTRFRCKPKSTLNLWMKLPKVAPQSLLINRNHASPSAAFRKQNRADGTLFETSSPITDNATTQRFRVTGLKASCRY